MPRHADPEQRRRQVAEALLRVVETEGLDAASIPRIARELGATTGLVQTYFRSKDELLLFAIDHLGELVQTRVAAAIEASNGVKGRLHAGMSVLASGDESERDGEGRIWLAFLARAVNHPGLRERHLAGAEEIRSRCQYAFDLAKQHGLVAEDLDTKRAALALQAFADGLAVQRALEPEHVTKAYARSLLEEYLDRIFLPDGGKR
jgi:AcrR family transcriptional regulator